MIRTTVNSWIRKAGIQLIPALPLVLFFIILSGIFGQTLFPAPGRMIYGNDIYDLQYFARLNYHNSLHSGTIPWWNPHQFSGTPAAANPEGYNLFYPPSLLFYFLSVPQAMAWYLLLHTWIAMAGMYVLVYRFAGRLPAFFAGISFGLSGFFLPRVYAGHVDLLASAAYMPLVVATLYDLVAAKRFLIRKALIASFAVALQLLAGYQTMALYTYEVILMVLISAAVWRRSLRPVIVGIGTLLLGGGLAAVEFLPNLEFLSRSFRTRDLPYDWVASGSLSVSYLPQLIYGWYDDWRLYSLPRPLYPEHIVYFGVVALILAVVALIYTGTRSFRLRQLPAGQHTFCLLTFLATLIAAVSLWISFGVNAPIDLNHVLWSYMPLYRLFRIPPRHLVLFIFAGSFLAGMGLALVRRRNLQFVLILLLLIELTVFSRHYIDYGVLPETQNDPQAIAVLKDGGGELIRFLPNYVYTVRLGNTLDLDAAASYGLFSVSGFDPLILGNYYDFYTAAMVTYDPNRINGIGQMPVLMMNTPGQGMDFLNAKYYLGQGDASLTDTDNPDRYVLRYQSTGRWSKIVENTTYLPRFFLVPSMAVLPSRDAVAAEIRNGTADLSNQVLTTGISADTLKHQQPDCSMSPLPPVRVVSYGVNDITLSTDVQCNAYLSSSEVMYPGWTAYVDGKKTDIIEGNLAFRALYVSGGKHTIELRFVPYSFYIGGVISVLSVGTVVWLAVRKRKQPVRNA